MDACGLSRRALARQLRLDPAAVSAAGRRGLSDRQADEWAHASPALTLSIYSHVLPRQQAAAAAAFAKLVDDGPTCDDCGEPLDDNGPLCDRCAGPNDHPSAGHEPA